MVTTIVKILRVLNSETDPAQIGLAFSLSLIVGLTPNFGLHGLLALFLVLVLRANLSMFIIGVGLFALLSFALDPLFHHLGLFLLTMAPLQGLWTHLYNSPLWRLEHFNNTIVIGSLVVALVMFVPLFLLTVAAVQRYREHILARLKKIGVVRMIMAGRLYSAYQTLAKLEGKT